MTTSALGARLAGRLRSVDGVVESPSMFGTDNAFWCNGTEIAHFDADAVVDVRLTKLVIRALRPRLRADPRIEMRRGTSDWVEVRVASDEDIDFVVELAEHAAGAHRPRPGEKPKAPPLGPDLDRRRRLH